MIQKILMWCLAVFVGLNTFAASAQNAPATGRKILPGHIASRAKLLAAVGSLAATNEIRMAIGLALRDPAGLDRFLAEVSDPASPNFRKYLTPDELAARFGPSEADYESVKKFALTNGFKIVATHGNRMVLDVIGAVTNVDRAFNFHLKRFQHPTESRQFFAPDAEPSVDVGLPVADVQGLSDFSRPHPRLRHSQSSAVFKSGTSPDGQGLLFGDDFRKAYAPGTTLTGAGQMVGLVQFDGYYTNDILAYARAAGGGRTNIVVQNVLLDGYNGTPTTGANSGNGEVSLDIEMAMSVAPGLAKIVVFEAGPSGSQNDILNSMLTFTNTVKNLSCSWGWGGGPSTTTDNIFKFIAAAGQSFFNASGDTDAFVTGSNNDVDNTSQANAPSSCPYITQVGGTVMATSGFNGAYTSESVWNDRTVNANGGNWGSSGGISTYYAIPSWQTNTSMASNSGSTTKRNIPDVALTADYVYSTYDNGSSGRTGGTSCASPLWAGFMALVNQQIASQGGTSAGFINPAIYTLSQTANYAVCFHDTTVGDNSWSSSGGKFAAVTGYDLATGLGSPTGTNLINALAPNISGPAQIVASPASQTNSYGGTVTFTATAAGTSPLSYQWYFTNAIVGATSATLVLNNLVATNAGNYFVVVSNSLGSVTSAVVGLTVILSPTIASAPQGKSILIGQTASFSVTAAGAPPLIYQWRKNSNNIAGANATTYSIASAAASDAGFFDVIVTNFSGSVTSAVASLAVNNPASYSGVLAGWDVNNASSWGASPLTPTTNAPNVAVNALTRGSGLTTSGTAASRAWGGTGWSQTTAAAGATANQFASFGLVVANGYTVSFSSVSKFGYRRSGSGPPSGVLQFQLGGGAFTDIATMVYSVATSSGGTVSAIDLSGVAALQNVPAGTNINFRIVNYGATGATGTWYIYDGSAATPGVDDFEITGSLSPVANPLPTITSQPSDTNVYAGMNARFNVTASGSQPLFYQWQKNGFAIADAGTMSGSISNVLKFEAAFTNHTGAYSLVVTNTAGAVTSSVAQLNVLPPPGLNISNAAGAASLQFNGLANHLFSVQRSTNLFSWITVWTTNPPAAGTFQFSEPPTNSAGTFYRLNVTP